MHRVGGAALPVDRVITLSDYRNASFGNAYGVLIQDMGLLARAVFILDQKRIIRHFEIVEDISNEPDYALIIETTKNYMELDSEGNKVLIPNSKLFTDPIAVFQ